MTPTSFRRYRRRILALGVVAFLVIFAIGSAIAIPIVQNDLEDRVEAELTAHDVVGVTASFSGQDGTLVCAHPLDEPDRAVQLGSELRGVRTIELDPTCFPDEEVADVAPTPGSTPEAVTDDPIDDTGDTTTDATVGDSTPTTDGEADAASIVETLDQDPLFDQMSELVASAGLDAEGLLGTSGPITLFAPTDAAFDAAFDTLGADLFGEMTADPELVRALLRHHVTVGELPSDAFEDGPIEMLDGSTVLVDAAGPTFESGGSTVGVADPDTQLDIRASNGIVHAVDGILLPDDFVVPSPPDGSADEELPPGAVGVEYLDGLVVINGAVSSDDQLDQLRAAAESNVDAENIVDEVTIDADDGPSPAEIDALAVAVEAMVGNLVEGDAVLADGEVTVSGTPFDTAGRAAFEELAEAAGVTLELTRRPVADDESAADLQRELKEFVQANPIDFEPASIELADAAIPIVDQIAARASRLDGVEIVVVGFTDSEGAAESNELYSLGRALVVGDRLIDRGLAADAVSAEGRGDTEPVLGADGTEDRAASRRVEFVVSSRR